MRYGFGDRDNRCGISTVLESRAVYDRHVVRFPSWLMVAGISTLSKLSL